MLGGAIDVCIEGSGPDAHMRGGARDAKSNLAAIRYYDRGYGCDSWRRRRRGRGRSSGREKGARSMRGPEGKASVGAFEGPHDAECLCGCRCSMSRPSKSRVKIIETQLPTGTAVGRMGVYFEDARLKGARVVGRKVLPRRSSAANIRPRKARV